MKKENLLFLAEATIVALIVYNVSDYLFLRKFVSSLVSSLLLRLGVDAPSHFLGGELLLGDYLFTKNCVALSVLSLISGLLFAGRGKAEDILLSALAVLSVVSILNIARLVATYLLLSRNVSFFWAHDVVANGSAILLAFFLFWVTDPLYPSFRNRIFDVLDDAEKDVRRIYALLKANFK